MVSHEISRPLWAHARLRHEPAEIMKTLFLQQQVPGVRVLVGCCGQPALVKGHGGRRAVKQQCMLGGREALESVCVRIPLKCDAWRCSQHGASGGKPRATFLCSAVSVRVY